LCLHALGQLQPAIRAFRGALALDPGMGPAHLELGNAYLSMGRLGVENGFALAADEFRRALELDRKDALAAHNLGVAREEGGDLAGAARAYFAALTLAPEAKPTRMALAGSYERLGRWIDAMKIYDRGLFLVPTDLEYGSGLKRCQERLDDPKRKDAGP
jgi:tetratricopeptide (TPR) repeat protein